MTTTTGSIEQHARRLAARYPNGSTGRCAALVVAVAAHEMRTPVQARRLIAEHFAGRPRNADVGRAALALLEQLTASPEATSTEGTPR